MTRRRAWLWALALAASFSLPATAHEVRPGYLELRETAPGSYDVLWRVPAKGDFRLAMYPRFPGECVEARETVSYRAGGAYTDRWSLSCPAGLAGQSITIDGLPATLTDVLARVEWADGTTQVARLTPGAPAFVVRAAPKPLEVAGTYLVLGVEHILLGIDHLLFILGLLMLVRGWRRLLATVTAFTLAHSLTLAAAVLGFVHVPQPPVEAVIALSIVFVAAEIVHGRQGRAGITERAPWIVAFTFGLLHGFGFAGALTEVGLPQQAIPVALLCFNLGVELGQLLFIAGLLTLVQGARRCKVRVPDWAAQLSAYAMGALATFWCLQRVAVF